MPTIITFGQLASQAFGAMRRRLDRYFSNVVLLLTGRPVSGYSYIKDASTNNSALTVTGTVSPNRSNPFLGSYYSVYNSGNQSCFYAPSNTVFNLATSNFTIEMWVNPAYYVSNQVLFAKTPNSSTYGSYEVRIAGTSTSIGTVIMYLGSTGSSWDIASGIGTGTVVWNTWNHIALTRSGTTFTLWVNGVASGTATSSASLYTNTSGFGIGGYVDGSFNINLGYYSNLRMINGTAIYTANFIPPTSPLTAIANTVLLTCQSNKFVDNSLNAFSLTLVTTSGTPQIKSNTPFAVSNASGYYSYSYSSSTGYLLTPATQTQFGFGTADYSIEMWVNMASTSAYGRVFTASGNNSNMDFAVGGVFTYYDGASYTGGTFVAGTWTHVAITRNSSVLRVFQDGKLVYNGSNSTNIGTTNQYAFAAATNGANPTNQYQSNIRIVKGGIPSAYVTSNTTNGTQVFIPSRVPFTGSESLTAGSVALLTGQANGVIDTSVNGINFTVAGSVTTVPNNPFSKQTNAAGYWSGSFNGSAYITTPYNSAFQVSGDMTIEFWVNFSATFTNAGLFMFDGFSGYGITIDTSRWVVSWLGVNIIIGTTGASIPSPSVWTHVALVRNSGTVRLYINGVQLSSAAGAAVTVVTGTFDIGRGNDGTAFNTTGYISNFRYVSGTCLYPSGTTFTPPTAPLTAISGTAFLTLQNSQFIDNSTNAFTITNGSATNSTIQPFGTPVLTPAVPTVDYSPQNQTTLVTNNAGYYSGYFDGSTGYLTVPANAAFGFGTGNFTWEAWLYISAATNNEFEIWESQTTGAFVIYKPSSGASNAICYRSYGGSDNIIVPTASIPYQQWFHLAVVRSGTNTVKSYLNGVNLATFSDSTNFVTPTAVYSIAARNGGTNFMPNGYISNFRIVNGTAVYTTNFTPPTSPLTAITNTALLTCQNSTYIDNSTNSFAITPNGKTQPSTYQPFPNTTGYWSGSFNGTSQYLNTTSSSSNYALGSGAYTVETWVYITGTSATYGFGVFGTYYTTLGWSLTLNRSTGGPIGVYWISGGAGQITTSAYVSSNVWVHIAVVRTSTATNGTVVYVNGTAVATGTDATNDTYVNNLYIGNQGPGSTYFPGYISNARLVKGTAVYTSNFTPPTTPLTAITNTQFLSCQNNTFIDNSTNAAAITNNGSAVAFTNQPFTPTPLSLGYATSTAVTPASYGAGLFDGSSYLSVTQTAISSGADFTMEMWVYPTSTSTNTGLYSAAASRLGLIYLANGGPYWLGISPGDISSSGGTMKANSWQHIAVSRQSGTLRIFYNGALVGSGSNTDTISNVTWYVGSDTSAEKLSGYISNLRVVAGTALYTSNFIPPTAPLSPVTNTSLLTLQNKQSINNNVFYDDSSNNFALTKTGTVAQGSFTPFAPAYSNYFGASGTGFTGTATGGLVASTTTTWTAECWVYMTQAPTAGTSPTVIGLDVSSGSSTYLSFYVNSSQNVGILWFDSANKNCTTTSTVPLNQWTHIAASVNSNTIQLYINGVSQSLTGTTTLTTRGGTTNSFAIAYQSYTTAYQFYGYISNARVVTGTALYTSNFAPPTSPLTAITNTRLLTCQSNRFIDNGPNGYTLTIVGTPQVQAFSPFNPEYAYNPATNGGSMWFDGTSGYLATATSAIFTTGQTTPFTIEVWVYITSNAATATIIGDPYTTGSFTLIINTTGKLAYNYLGGSATTGGNLVVPLNAWTHVAATRTGTSTYLYVNGVADSGNPFTNNSFDTGVQTSFYIGATASSSSIVNYFPGYISNVRYTPGVLLYTGAFTPPTAPFSPLTNTGLLTLGTNAGLTDFTGLNDAYAVGTVAPYTQPNTVKLVNGSNSGAVYFNGSNYLALPNSPAYAFYAGNFTVECWINLTSAGSSNVTLLSYNYQSATPTGNWAFYLNGTGPYTLYFNSGSTNHSSTTTTTISTGTWYHVAYCRSGTSGYFFVNGTQVGTTITDSTSYTTAVAGPMYVGVMSNLLNYMTGYMQEARVTNGVARYTANFTPPAAVFPVI